MAKSFESHTKNIGSILGHFESHVVQVPRFQRGFSWEKAHVTDFWIDIIAFLDQYTKDSNATYFLGPIVIEERSDKIILLDGQQRMATTTILLSTVRDLARSLAFSKGTPGADFARDIQKEIIIKEDDQTVKYSLELGELDRDFFKKVIQEDPPTNTQAKLKSHVLIAAAAASLRTSITELIKGLPSDESLRKLKRLKDCVVKGMTVVAIYVRTEDDAYNIFETLNDRGLRLSVPDLLLNLLMRRSANDSERRDVRKKWNYMLKEIGRRDIARFLRHMWISRYGDVKARGLFTELKHHLSQKRLTSNEFMDACVTDCDSYISLLDQTGIPKEANNDVAGLIRYLGITSSLPLLLSGLQSLSDNDFIKLARIVVSLSVRYSVIGDLNPNTLENAFYAAARKIREMKAMTPPQSSKQCLNAAKSILAPLNPLNFYVEQRAQEVLIDRASALWLVTAIANSQQSVTKEVGISNANLEHIFPQNADAINWPNHLDLTDSVWRLGNLTILSTKLNNQAGRKAFAVKTQNYYKRSEIKITKQIAQYSKWTPTELEKRSKKIAQLLVGTFN